VFPLFRRLWDKGNLSTPFQEETYDWMEDEVSLPRPVIFFPRSFWCFLSPLPGSQAPFLCSPTLGQVACLLGLCFLRLIHVPFFFFSPAWSSTPLLSVQLNWADLKDGNPSAVFPSSPPPPLPFSLACLIFFSSFLLPHFPYKILSPS